MNIFEIVNSAKQSTISHKALLLLIVCAQFLPLLLVGQSLVTSKEITSLIDSTQKIYGKSDLLVNGSVYYQTNRQASGTPFLFSSVAEKGVVFTRGIAFKGVGLNYNIASQKLLLLNTLPDGSRLLIDLSDVLIDSFLIKDYFFVAPARLHIKSSYPYLMAVNSDTYSLFIGFKKEFINRFNQRNPYGKFSSTKRTLFLVSNSIPVRINSKRTLLNTFPSARKKISTYLRQHKIKLLRATPEQLKQLMEFYNHQRELANE